MTSCSGSFPPLATSSCTNKVMGVNGQKAIRVRYDHCLLAAMKGGGKPARRLLAGSATFGKAAFNSSPIIFLQRSQTRRHQKNHTRPSRCQQCTKRFPSPKDLERHNNSVHDHTIKFFCTHDWCRASIKLYGPDSQEWFNSGFSRKDHWQKHMRKDHWASRDFMKDLWKNGTLIARKADGRWIPVFPKVFDIPSQPPEEEIR